MGTIVDKLNKLLTTKSDIKAALIEKGQNATELFSQYPTLIRNIIKLSSISVTTNPTKTSYTAKESFSSSGMVVRATFSNSAYKNVTGYTVSPSGALKPTDKSVTISYKEFGETKETSIAISVAAIKVTVPSQSGTLTYTGSTLMPVWDNLNRNLVDISGIQYAVYAGTYTALFILKDKTNYTWADGTTADKSVTWTIGKAQASISLSKNSVTLNGDKLTDTVTITSVGMNSVAAMSSDTSIATISMSGSTLTISNVNETTGTATIVLSGEVNSNYNAPTYPSIAVSAEFAHDVVIAGGVSMSAAGALFKISVDGVENVCYPAFNLVTQSTALVKAISSNPTLGKIILNGETVLSGTGEYTLDLSDVTHVVAKVSASTLNITTYNLAEPKDITVTVTGAGGAASAFIAYNGINYTSATTFTAKTGDLIYVKAGIQAGYTEYYHVITSDMIVKLTSSSNTTGTVTITEIPEGHALVTVRNQDYEISGCSVTIDGVTYQNSATVVVPIGTQISCYVSYSIRDREDYGYITVNDVTVATADTAVGVGRYETEYYYTVIGETLIDLYYTEGEGGGAIIKITEQ